jgi:hypothetical protein
LNLSDAAAYHAFALKDDGQPIAARRQQLHAELAFLRYLEWSEILPTPAALNASNISAAATWCAQPLVEPLTEWGRFLKREEIV